MGPGIQGEKSKNTRGYVSSANCGYTVGQSILYGYLPPAHAEQGTKVHVAYLCERYPATIVREPLYDPQHLKLQR